MPDSTSHSIVLVAPKYNYGRKQDGPSYEYYNFFDSLIRMGQNVLFFDFMHLLGRYGKERMNARLVDVVRSERPDILLAVPHRDELAPNAIRSISQDTGTTAVAWFSDDHWRFESHTAYWAPCFNWSVTTATSAVPKYRALGYANVIKSQWACNHFLYRPCNVPLRYSVTFVGQPHGTRRATIAALEAAGIPVQVWGRGWERGRLSQEEMLRVFSSSRINLNLSNSSPRRSRASRALALVWAAAGSDMARPPMRRVLHRVLAHIERSLSRFVPPDNSDLEATPARDQIKGRNFEIPGCAGFVLTGEADNLADYYLPRKEVATFSSVGSMVDQIRYYLGHEDERLSIAAAGHARTLHEHTYVHRFASIFDRLGLRLPPLDTMLAGSIARGQGKDVT